MKTFEQFLKEDTQDLKFVTFNREPNKHGYTDHFEFDINKKGFASLENRDKGSNWPGAIAVFDLNLPNRSGMIYQFTNPLPSTSKPLYEDFYREAGCKSNIMRWTLGRPAHYTVKKQIKEYTEYVKNIIDFMKTFDLKKREFYLLNIDKDTRDTWQGIADMI